MHVLHLSCNPTQNQFFFSFYFLMFFFFFSSKCLPLLLFPFDISLHTHSSSLSLSYKNEETSPPSFHSHTHKLNYSIHNQTHKSYLPIIYRRSSHTFHLQRSSPIYYHFQLPHFTQSDAFLIVFFVNWENLGIQNKAKGYLGMICITSNGNNASKSAFLYSISEGPLPKCAFGLIAISKCTIWKSYQTRKNEKKKSFLKSQSCIWSKNVEPNKHLK